MPIAQEFIYKHFLIEIYNSGLEPEVFWPVLVQAGPKINSGSGSDF